VLLGRNGSDQDVSQETGRTQKICGVKDLWKVNFKRERESDGLRMVIVVNWPKNRSINKST